MINNYQVNILGENIFLLIDGDKKRCGFYINVCVKEVDENRAFDKAKKVVLNKLKKDNTVDIVSFEVLNLTLEKIEIIQVNIDSDIEQGFVWYQDTDSNN